MSQDVTTKFNTQYFEGMTLEEELAYLLERAEAGHPTYQYLASQRICSSESYPDRQVEALKWIIIARTFDVASGPQEVLDYLSTGLSDSDRERAFDLAESWLEERQHH
jgi:hypothetical protein